jgi:methionyl-tRNA synthetase
MNIASYGQFEKSFSGPEPLTAVIAPPPTPNGDLHLGHLAGPYLFADVLARYQTLRGRRCVSAISVDLHQSYVVTTAERLGVEPADLAQRQFHNIQATLEAAEICFDVVGMPDATYTTYVREWFRRLHAGGAFEMKETTAPYDANRRRFLFEAYASGWCPTCLAATKGNICEACGHPNEPARLFNLHATGSQPGQPLEMRRQVGLVLNLERWRNQMMHHLLEVLPELRPTLRCLIDELFSEVLPAFPITFPSTWGIPAPFPDCQDQVLNVWAEMVPGHYYWLERANVAKGGATPLLGGDTPTNYVQFLGFDNSFYYACAHLALAFAARDLGVEALIPCAIVTNEFYQLNSFKFSTSQGHAIWGQDFLKEVSADEARFYFAWSSPEKQQSNFSRLDFEAIVHKEFRAPLSNLHNRLYRMPKPLSESAYMQDSMAKALLDRFAAAYEPTHPSLRLAAQTLASGLSVAIDRAQNDANVEGVGSFIVALAAGAMPLVPNAAASLMRAIGDSRPPAWPMETNVSLQQGAATGHSRLTS